LTVADTAIGGEHTPVLENEVLEHLLTRTDGIYIDATFGRGGHCRAILARLESSAKVIALDRDPAAVIVAEALAAGDARLIVRHRRFAELAEVLAELGIDAVDGVLLDIGVSSPQLDDATRGFSFLNEGPLDMRMDPSTGESAADWLNREEESTIAEVLREFGEERHARRIARAIVAARPLRTTGELAEVVVSSVPGRSTGRQRHPATKTFQAVRIKVNAELDELERGMGEAFAALKPGGRLAVISFHSLEDRAVKNRFRSLAKPPELPRRLPVRASAVSPPGRLIAGPVRAGAAEVNRNPRARSATLRVIERTDAVEAEGDGR
jgi:16S rRNA (cytosine1402-N4)-methyltransferase